MNEKDIARINELYHKEKTEGLTPEEKQEQMHLRGAYIAAIRRNLRVNPDGSVINVKERHKEHMEKEKKKYS